MHGVVTLAHYPLDLIEHIIFHVTDPFDLFSLALSSKQLYSLIIPNQLDFRTIRCDPRRGRLWKYLREQPRLTSRIRSLELVIENASVAPVIPRVEAKHLGDQHGIAVDHMSQSLDNCLLTLIEAVKHMNRLIRFCWCDCGPASNETEALIATLFNYCPDLRELQVQYGRRETSTYLIKSKLSFLQLHCLSKVSFRISGDTLDTADYGQEIKTYITKNCPALEDLHIEAESPQTLQLLGLCSDGTVWPRLNRFTIINVYIFASSQPDCNKSQLFIQFLENHPRIEYLCLIDTDVVILGRLSFSAVRSLCSIHFVEHDSRSNITTPFRLLKTLPSATVQSLSHFQGPIDAKAIPLLARMKSLRSCVPLMKQNILSRLVSALPKLERLSVTSNWHGKYRGSEMDPALVSHLESLLTLVNLTHLAGFMTSISIKSADGLRILRRLASLRKLRYVQVRMWKRVEWIALLRNEAGDFVGYRIVQNTQLNPEYWGGFFRGFLVV